MKALFLAVLFALAVLLVGCTQQSPAPLPAVEQGSSEQVKEFTLEDVAAHSSEDDCWMAIGGKVYDVTKNVGVHPGGKAMLEGCGKDATALFETRPMGSGTPHSDKARQYLAKAYIGDLKQ